MTTTKPPTLKAQSQKQPVQVPSYAGLCGWGAVVGAELCNCFTELFCHGVGKAPIMLQQRPTSSSPKSSQRNTTKVLGER